MEKSGYADLHIVDFYIEFSPALWKSPNLRSGFYKCHCYKLFFDSYSIVARPLYFLLCTIACLRVICSCHLLRLARNVLY